MNKTIITFSELNKLKTEIYGIAVAHGFHDEKLTVDHSLGLVLSEIGEAINADRNPDAPVPTQQTIDEAQKLVGQSDEQQKAFAAYFKEVIKGSVVEELADVAIRILDLAGSLDVEFDSFNDIEIVDWFGIETLPDRLFCFAMELEDLSWHSPENCVFANVLEDITNIANDFTHLNLWQVVRLKMRYNDMRPRLNGKKY